jgi:hypothetical protein
MSLTRESFESGVAAMVKVRKVPIPELNDDAWIRILPSAERDAYDRSVWDDDGKRIPDVAENLPTRLIVLCLCDEHGERMYPDPKDDTPNEGLAIVAAWPTPIAERLFIASRTFNMMGKDDLEKAAKNFEKTRDDSSDSD